jgi:hypothetical protein
MSKKDKSEGSDYREASTLLEAALAQLAQVDRALAVHPSDALNAAAGRAKEAVSRIRSAMSSGTLDAAALVSCRRT